MAERLLNMIQWVDKFFGKKKITITPIRNLAFFDSNFSQASKFIPEWYKKIKPFNDNKKNLATIKKCIPVLDSMSQGYIIYTTEDLFFDENQKTFTDFESLTPSHSEEQIEGYPVPDYFHKIIFKWENIINIKTPKGYSCLFIHPLHRLDLPFYTLPGLVDTDMHPLNINFPFFMKKGFTGVIPAKTPLIQIIPIKRDSWSIKNGKKNKNTNNVEEFEKRFKSAGLIEINDVYKNHYREKKEF